MQLFANRCPYAAAKRSILDKIATLLTASTTVEEGF
jgi:hypothetical protein